MQLKQHSIQFMGLFHTQLLFFFRHNAWYGARGQTWPRFVNLSHYYVGSAQGWGASLGAWQITWLVWKQYLETAGVYNIYWHCRAYIKNTYSTDTKTRKHCEYWRGKLTVYMIIKDDHPPRKSTHMDTCTQERDWMGGEWQVSAADVVGCITIYVRPAAAITHTNIASFEKDDCHSSNI